ncbi:hypothetical protein [Cryobacterium soli]|uniref:hypothetical protein n=1 Tax=Cryobacterium soli TaxID=2220095 RepID=UPI0013C47B39|nr:hypothetical protein [Cryobacterium soli]
MKKKLALGLALIGATSLALSLTVFAMGAAATLNPTATNSPSAQPPETSPAPVSDVVPTPTVSPAAPAGETSEVADSADPFTSDKFMALTPDERANGRDWIETQTITAACMKDQGYAYTFEPYWERAPGVMPESWESTLPNSQQAGARLALDGDTGGGADYHWDEAGCYGYAVHVMGNDNAH